MQTAYLAAIWFNRKLNISFTLKRALSLLHSKVRHTEFRTIYSHAPNKMLWGNTFLSFRIAELRKKLLGTKSIFQFESEHKARSKRRIVYICGVGFIWHKNNSTHSTVTFALLIGSRVGRLSEFCTGCTNIYTRQEGYINHPVTNKGNKLCLQTGHWTHLSFYAFFTHNRHKRVAQSGGRGLNGRGHSKVHVGTT
jgi:hypothetical protein